MHHDEHLGQLWEHGLGLAFAAERAGLDAPVQSCPGWSVADLVWHILEVQDFWRWVVAEEASDPSGYAEPERPADAELIPVYRRGVDALLAVLRDAEPETTVWSWAPRGHTAGWVVRRQAQEAAVHRWDAEAAAGTDWAVPADLAVDGVDEFFEHFVDSPGAGAAAVDGTVHLHCTDAEGEWLVTEPDAAGRLAVATEHAKGDAAVRGVASDLLLLLWRRIGLDDQGDRFEVFGDRAVLDRLLARTDLG
jgi:uncharacterized protein (TIGR03083 family)